MKNKKKLLAVLLAAVMIMAMGITAFAADGGTYAITITKDATDKAAHTYGAYQVFKGDLSVDSATNTKTLSNIQWGASVDTSKVADLIAELNAIDGVTIAANANAATIAKAISDANLANDSAKAQAVADAFNKILLNPVKTQNTPNADGKYVIDGLAAGYYLVKDAVAVTGQGAQTRFILEVVSDVNVNEKANIPSVEKKLKDINDTDGRLTDWQDSADYDIGDKIPYKLTGTLPGKYDEYDTYTVYKFTDTLSAGLTPPETADEVKVTLDTEDGTDITSLFDVAINGQVITITLQEGKDLKKDSRFTKDSKIIVTYEATLNENAVIGQKGNPNKVDLEFTNNPNYDGEGTGKTPEDTVIVFTYKTTVTKVDENEAALNGADFTLYKEVPQGTEGAQTGAAIKDNYADNVSADALNNRKYYVVVGGKTGDSTGNVFSFKGIDDGTYVLVETTVPRGYNAWEAAEFVVEAVHTTPVEIDYETGKVAGTDTYVLTQLTGEELFGDEGPGTITLDATKADLDATIVNESGAVLPSTGGIGTTIFYVIGAILVLGAGVVLIARRRTNA